MFVNTQQTDILYKKGAKEFDKICSSHPGCIDCPLKREDKKYEDYVLQCVTGRMKG